MTIADAARRRMAGVAALVTGWLITGALALVPPTARAQLDVCGCAGSPESLGVFDSEDPGTYPAGSITADRVLQIPLPDDGVLVFDSFNLVKRSTDLGNINQRLILSFIPNAANTPVTLLVAGDLNIGPSAAISVAGSPGTSGSTGLAGIGGLGGPGGFRGGDGAYQNVNFATEGGAGLGPGGGAGGLDLAQVAQPGTFVGNVELRPLIGGGGGGGGASVDTTLNCSGGGGGGGGGAIVVAANGTATINGQVNATGGAAGSPIFGSCAGSGGVGSGGAVRITASAITGATGFIDARGGVNNTTFAGRISLEALSNDLPGGTGTTNPVAQRFPSPGPVVNPLTPAIAITAINGDPVPDPPQGGFGEVDVLLPAPGPVTVDVETEGVPQGTTVDVTVKPRIGGVPVVENVELIAGACNPDGMCFPSATFDLGAGAYTVEARATFATP